VLSDPGHPDHGEMVAWLGLADATEFDPDGFDAEAVNEALSALR
jgi:hypothetical protein